MRDLAADGGEFADHLPDDLPYENAPTEQPCLALTADARVDRPDLADHQLHLLRPHYRRPVPARPVDARDPRVEGENPMTWEPYTPEQLAELAATESDDATEPDGDAELDGDVHDPDCLGIHQGTEVPGLRRESDLTAHPPAAGPAGGLLPAPRPAVRCP